MKEYKTRIIEDKIKRKMKGKGAILIEGPKWCGKTTTCEKLSKSALYMSDPENVKQNVLMADIQPKYLLNGDTPRLIDEWQIAPKLWDAIRFEVDHRDDFGQFILNSSTMFDLNNVFHSGIGRFAYLTMRPMSLYESGESNGKISLSDLFSKKAKGGCENKLTLLDIAYLCCRGGWPNSLNMEKDVALEQAYDYYDAVIKYDISRVDGITKNKERVQKLMKSYARNIASGASNETIKNDIINNDSFSLNTDTVVSYINALKKIFVIEEAPSWNPNLRSKTAIRTSDTRYFIDPSIACACLEIGPNDLINDLNTFGLIFESLCIRDLRVYADYSDGVVYHYRDASDLECDAVIHLRNGNYGLVEIKLGGDKLIEEGISNLLKLRNKLDTDKMKAPSFLMILTATSSYAYQTEDGIWIVPISCLKN